MKLCAGRALKIAALRSIELCREGKRPSPPGPCQLFYSASNGRCCVMCFCGAASTWQRGPGQTGLWFSSTFLTEVTDDDIRLLQMSNCVQLSMPSSRSSRPWQMTADEFVEHEANRHAAAVLELAFDAVCHMSDPFVMAEGLSDTIGWLCTMDRTRG